MKKITLVATTLALVVTAGSALAAGSAAASNTTQANTTSTVNSLSTGTFGLTVSTASNTMIAGKYFLANDVAVLAGFGLADTSNGVGTDLYLMAGIRKYIKLEKKSDNFVPFVGGRILHSSVNSANTSNFGISAEAGAEYFLDKHFSLEGLVSAGFGSTTPSGGSATTTLSTSVYSIGANFYF
jgi:hypothetical protein